MAGNAGRTLGIGGLVLLLSCGGESAANSRGGGGQASLPVGQGGADAGAGGAAGGTFNTGSAGSAGTTAGTGGTPRPNGGCTSGVIASDKVCVAAANAWDWASGDDGGSAGASANGANGGESGDGGSGGESQPVTPDGCPRTHLIRSHLELLYPTVYDPGTREGDQCCYSSFLTCG